jgi:hypothetical protein
MALTFCQYSSEPGFKQTRFDNNVWFRLKVNGEAYDYLCTHVDHFMICGKDAQAVMDCIKDVCYIKDIQPSTHYFGNYYKKDRQDNEALDAEST